MDSLLPVLTGAEGVERCCQLPRPAKSSVSVVCFGGEGVREAALRAGADLFLDKPLLLKHLLVLLCLLVAKQRQSAAA